MATMFTMMRVMRIEQKAIHTRIQALQDEQDELQFMHKLIMDIMREMRGMMEECQFELEGEHMLKDKAANNSD